MKRFCVIVAIVVFTLYGVGQQLTQDAAKLHSGKRSMQPDPRPYTLPSRNVSAIKVEPPPHEKTGPKLPLEFEANRGQAAAQYDYVAHGPTYALGISSTEIALSLHGSGEAVKPNLVSASLNRTASARVATVPQSQLRLHLLGANRRATVAGLDPKPGLSNYFIGNDPKKWQTRVPHFGKVSIAGVYPGIDLVFYGNPQQLEYDFRVNPGADPATIRLAAGDAKLTALDGNGDAVLSTGAGEVRLKHPRAYQQIGSERRPVASKFRIATGRTLQFQLGAYDHSKALIIDPVLLYSVTIAGSSGNQGFGMDVDAAGNSYVTGSACSSGFPTTVGNFQDYQNDVAGFACQNAFVFKLDPTGSTLIYSDFVGGSGASTGTHIAVDASGNAYVTGATTSTDFPLISNIGPTTTQACPLFTSYNTNCPDGFIFKLAADGASMIFSSLLGGSQTDIGFQVKLNPVTGDLVVLGETDSSDFLPALTTLQTSYEGGTCANNTPCLNAFLLGLNPSTGALRYGTFLGGTGDSIAAGLGFDATGNAYVAGSTTLPLSSSLGTVTHTYTPTGASAGGMDIFVAQLKLSQSSLKVGYLTLIEGESDDLPAGIAIDSSGDAYLTGTTASKHLPVTSGVYQTTNPSTGAAGCIIGFSFPPVSCGTTFVGKIGSTGALSFLTYLGGSGTDWGEAVGVDKSGNIWLAGSTSSSDFPFSKDTYAPAVGYETTPYLAEMSNDGATLSYASPLAGLFGGASDLKIDSSNNVYVTGDGLNSPITPGTYSANTLSDINAIPMFVQKWNAGAAPSIQLSTNAINFPGTAVGAASAPQTVTVTNSGAGALQLGMRLITSVYGDLSDATPPDFTFFDNCGGSLAGGDSCTITLQFEPLASLAPCTTVNGCYPQSPTAELIILNNAPAGTQKVALSGTLGQGPIFAAAPPSVVFPPQTADTTSPQIQVNADNMGDVGLQISNVSISGPNASEFGVTEASGYACSGPGVSPVGSGGNCVVYVTFSPAASATGTRTATLNFADNAPGNPHSISLSGTVATAAPALIFSPTSATLAPAAIGATTNPDDCSACAFFTISNSSSNSLQLTALTLSGTNAGDFFVNTYPPLPVTIQPGNQISFEVYFSPASGNAGVRTATLTPTTNPAATGLPTLQLKGGAVTNSNPSLFTFSNPSPLDFGTAEVGQTSAVNSNFINIENNSPRPCAGGASSCGGPLVISSMATGLSDFTLFAPSSSSNPSYCSTTAMTIPAGGVCQFVVLFAPAQAGSRNTSLTIKSNDLLGPMSIPLLGAGLASPLGNLSVTALDFGYDAIGVASPPLTVTLMNSGAGALSLSKATTSANFSVSSNTCNTPVAPGASCIIGVTFTPPSAGGFSGTLNLSDDTLSGQQVVALNGTGATGTLLLLNPATVNFGNQIVGEVSAAQTLTVTNTGDMTVTFPANLFRVSTDFLLQSTTCGTSLAVGASCVVSVQFKPSIPYAESGSLTLSDNARGNPQTVFMAGAGVQRGSNKSTTTLASSANPAITGQSITFTAMVSGTTTNTPAPTGSVTFLDGTTTLGTSALSSSGIAMFSTTALPIGSDSIVAIYEGDANFNDSTSTALTETVKPAATLTAPTPGSVLAGPSVTFTWTAVSGSSGYWLFLGTTGVGSKNLFDSNEQKATSATFNGLPTNGETVYARVYTSYNGNLVYNDYTYTAWREPAVLTVPTPGTTLAGTSATFTWTAVSGSSGYWLFLGTTGVGSKNLFDSNEQKATSATFNGLPTNGETIYARVYTSYNGNLVYNDYTYTAWREPAVLTAPTPGTTLSGTSATFTWTAVSGSSGYWLFLGTTGVGSKNLFDSNEQKATSATFNGLPTNGETIYARVYTSYNGVLVYNDYTYIAFGRPAILTSPTPGSTLTSASAMFTWTVEPGNQGYWLFLGTAGVGSKNLYDSGQQTATSDTFSNLPTNGATIYARVYTKYNGTLFYNDYTYKAWMKPPVMTSPTPGSTLAGTSATFTWTAETGSAGYWLFLGTAGVGSKNLFDSNEQKSTSATFSNLPTNGATIYARVYASYNGVLVYNDYTYTAP